jgi:SNARE protein
MLRDGFRQTDKIEGDPATATAHLKGMTSKMAESKRLIKEFERVSLEDPAADPAAVAARKKAMVQALNAFVNRKKSAQADVAARVAEAAEKAEAASAAAAEKAAPAAPSNPFSAKSSSSSSAAPSSGASAANAAAAAAAAGADAASERARRAGKAPADAGGVELQMMETEDALAYGRGKMRETDDAIERSRATVANTIQLGTQTAEALRHQTGQMEKIVDDLDEIHFSLKKATRVIKDLTRGLATDKCILTLLFIVVAGVVTVIAVKAAGLDKDDEVAKVRRMYSRRMLLLWEEEEEDRRRFGGGEPWDARSEYFRRGKWEGLLARHEE